MRNRARADHPGSMIIDANIPRRGEIDPIFGMRISLEADLSF